MHVIFLACVKSHQIRQVVIEPQAFANIRKPNEKSPRSAQEFKRKSIVFRGQYILHLELSLKSALWQHWGHLVKERGANKWASQTWQLVELQITSNLAKVYCSTRRWATCYTMHISPIHHHTSQDHEALPLRIFANKIKRRQKGGSLKTLIYLKPTSPYACAFQGGDETQSGQPPPRGS